MDKKALINEIIDYIKVIIITVCLTLLVLHFVQIARVVGDSMLPNYHEGNIVFVNKKFYHLKDCHYNDIVVAKAEIGYEEEEIIKRVMGLPGDTLTYDHGKMYRNGELLEETYIKEPMDDDYQWEVTIPEGHIFIMGDNRNNSADSRDIGPVEFDQIVGEVFFKLF